MFSMKDHVQVLYSYGVIGITNPSTLRKWGLNWTKMYFGVTCPFDMVEQVFRISQFVIVEKGGINVQKWTSGLFALLKWVPILRAKYSKFEVYELFEKWTFSKLVYWCQWWGHKNNSCFLMKSAVKLPAKVFSAKYLRWTSSRPRGSKFALPQMSLL